MPSGNPWLLHLNQFRADHPDLTFKQCMCQAKDTYKRPVKEQPSKEEAQEQ